MKILTEDLKNLIKFAKITDKINKKSVTDLNFIIFNPEGASIYFNTDGVLSFKINYIEAPEKTLAFDLEYINSLKNTKTQETTFEIEKSFSISKLRNYEELEYNKVLLNFSVFKNAFSECATFCIVKNIYPSEGITGVLLHIENKINMVGTDLYKLRKFTFPYYQRQYESKGQYVMHRYLSDIISAIPDSNEALIKLSPKDRIEIQVGDITVSDSLITDVFVTYEMLIVEEKELRPIITFDRKELLDKLLKFKKSSSFDKSQTSEVKLSITGGADGQQNIGINIDEQTDKLKTTYLAKLNVKDIRYDITKLIPILESFKKDVVTIRTKKVESGKTYYYYSDITDGAVYSTDSITLLMAIGGD